MNNYLSKKGQQINQSVLTSGFSDTALACIRDEEFQSMSDFLLTYRQTTRQLAPVYVRDAFLNNFIDVNETAEEYLSIGYKTSNNFTISMKAPISWSTKGFSRSEKSLLHSWRILDALLLADYKGNGDYLQISIKYIEDWIDTFIGMAHGEDFCWYDMAVGQRATKLSYILCCSINNNEDIRLIEKLIVTAEMHMRELMEGDNISTHSNHGLFQMLGLLTLGTQLPFLKSSEEAVLQSKKLITKMLKRQFLADGLHNEHSPVYHIYMTNMLSILLESGLLVMTEFKSLMEKAVDAMNYLVQPDGRIVNFGDSRSNAIAKDSVFDTGHNNTVCCAPVGLKYFEKFGMVVHSLYKEGMPSEYLAFSCAFHSRQHKHADDCNFQLFHNAMPILVDTGNFTYQYDLPERIYAESTRAHNCLEIDNCNYSRFSLDAFGNGIRRVASIGNCIVIVSFVRRKRLTPASLPNTSVNSSDSIAVNIGHTRVLLYHPDNYLLVIDVLASKREHEYTQWFNVSECLTAINDSQDISLVNKHKENIASVIYVGESIHTQKIINGEVKPRLQGWVSNDGHTLSPRDSIGFTVKGDNVTLATLIDFKPGRSRKVFFKSATNGKYLRFKIHDSDMSNDFIYRDVNSSVELIYKDNELYNSELL